MSFGIEPLQRQPASARIFETLREGILSLHIEPGTHLTEAVLAREFGVSTTPIREALQQLVQHGLADRETARGVTVHEITPDEIRDIFELRIMLEPAALRDSAHNLSEPDWESLRRHLERARDLLDRGDIVAVAECNGEFHWGLVARAGNRLLLKWLSELRDRHRLISVHGWAVANHSLREWDEHCEILQAARQGQIETAAELLANHIRRFMETTLQGSKNATRRDDGSAGELSGKGGKQ